jgi:hypothetical protein
MGCKESSNIHGIIGVPEIGQYMMLWQAIAHTMLTTEPDQLRWKWNASGIYSAHSAYLVTFHGSINYNAWKLTWNCWAPP